jgi:hypothetical protein
MFISILSGKSRLNEKKTKKIKHLLTLCYRDEYNHDSMAKNTKNNEIIQNFWERRSIFLFERLSTLISFITAVVVIVAADRLFAYVLFEPYINLLEDLFHISSSPSGWIDLSFAPEVWLALIGMVMGTLILVISIASQNTPKLIDLYLQDRVSLMFIWFLIVSSVHTLCIMMFAGDAAAHPSVLFNVNFLLLPGVILSFPYALYILNYTKPHNVIERLTARNVQLVKRAARKAVVRRFSRPAYAEEYQRLLCESLNQLDDLLTYLDYKEPKAEIIQRMGLIVRTYVRLKRRFHKAIFTPSAAVTNDISFQTMMDQTQTLTEQGTFYEQKVFRLLSNAYVSFMEQGEYDLASMCPREVVNCAQAAVMRKDVNLIDSIIIRLNTLLRFAIKDGAKRNDGRNLYNLIYYYSRFIKMLVRFHRPDELARVFDYLRIYGAEIHNRSRQVPELYFIVDAFAAEMKNGLMSICHKNWEDEYQAGLLGDFLELDRVPDMDGAQDRPDSHIRSGVRVIQVGLALYYIEFDKIRFAETIMDDMLEDRKVLGVDRFQRSLNVIYGRLRKATPIFWEDTDRGSQNIYYASHIEQLDRFREMMTAKMAGK